MKLKSIRILSVFAALLSVNASALNIGITSGGAKGTYIQIANDISTVLKKQGLKLNIYPSEGSLDNIDAVVEDNKIQFGIVQSDVLNFVNASKDRKLERIAASIKKVLPLYNEEIHLLAKKEIKSIWDLQGKVISIGSTGSGTHLTSHLILKKIKVWPQEKLTLSGEKALAALESGEIDAMFYVSGYPVKLFSSAKDITNYHLIPISEEVIKKYYVESTIPAGTYAWQKTAIPTVATKALLMSVDKQEKYCYESQKIMQSVHENMDWLIENGHPKWADVDLNFSLNRWQRYKCTAPLKAKKRL